MRALIQGMDKCNAMLLMKFLLSNVLLMMRLPVKRGAFRLLSHDGAGMNLADMIIRLKVLEVDRRPSLPFTH